MVLAKPGVGKTMLAVNWAVRTDSRTLYCSADTDSRLMTEQLAALATGQTRDLVSSRLETGGIWGPLYAQAVQERFPHFVLEPAASPSLEEIGERAEALTELWGETPDLIVIDTASDIRKTGRDWDSWEEAWLQCRDLARFFDSVVMLPHHFNRSGQGSMNPDRFAEIVLELSGQGDHLTVEVTKNRGGKKDFQVHLEAQYAYARLEEHGAGQAQRV